MCVCVGGGLVLNTFLKQASLAVFVGGGRYPGPVSPQHCVWVGGGVVTQEELSLFGVFMSYYTFLLFTKGAG